METPGSIDEPGVFVWVSISSKVVRTLTSSHYRRTIAPRDLEEVCKTSDGPPLILERQREGIAIAKREGKYRGRKPTLTAQQVAEAKQRLDAGVPHARVARDLVSHVKRCTRK